MSVLPLEYRGQLKDEGIANRLKDDKMLYYDVITVIVMSLTVKRRKTC